MNPGRNGHAVEAQTPPLVEHEPRIFVLRPEHYDKDAAVLKTWLDAKSFQLWQVPNITHHIQADGTIVVFALAIHGKERRVMSPPQV